MFTHCLDSAGVRDTSIATYCTDFPTLHSHGYEEGEGDGYGYEDGEGDGCEDGDGYGYEDGKVGLGGSA